MQHSCSDNREPTVVSTHCSASKLRNGYNLSHLPSPPPPQTAHPISKLHTETGWLHCTHKLKAGMHTAPACMQVHRASLRTFTVSMHTDQHALYALHALYATISESAW